MKALLKIVLSGICPNCGVNWSDWWGKCPNCGYIGNPINDE